MTTSYQNFAQVYDKFMDNIPYPKWGAYLYELFKQFNIKSGTLVELGCGTGTLSLIMARYGYQVLGVDNSVDMLTIAAEKTREESAITLICQDMQKLELPHAYNGFYCLCDSLNYLLTENDVLETFKGIKKYLKKNGIFIFDLKTPYLYSQILGDQTFCDHQPDCSYIWENSYFDKEHINQYDLTIFVRQEATELFKRFNETHHQRAFSMPEIIDLLTQSGLEYVQAYDACTFHPPEENSERIHIIARNGVS